MKYMAYVEKIDELIEEAVTININGVVFTGFSTVCPYKIEEGKNYPVILGITVFDDIEINEGIDGVKNLKRIDNSFKYRISGILILSLLMQGLLLQTKMKYSRNTVNTLTSMLKLKLIESILNL